MFQEDLKLGIEIEASKLLELHNKKKIISGILNSHGEYKASRIFNDYINCEYSKSISNLVEMLSEIETKG